MGAPEWSKFSIKILLLYTARVKTKMEQITYVLPLEQLLKFTPKVEGDNNERSTALSTPES